MGLAKHKKLSKSEYDSLSVKDEDTLYAVNQNGDFSEENLEDSAELYIGDKKITPTIVGTTGESTTSVMHQKAVTDAINLKLDEIDLSEYLPKAGGTVTGEFKTNSLTHLANSSNGKLQIFPNAAAIGQNSFAIGSSAKTGMPTGDSDYPYGYIKSYQTIPVSIDGTIVNGVFLTQGSSITYTFNNSEYTVTNPLSRPMSAIIVNDDNGLFLKNGFVYVLSYYPVLIQARLYDILSLGGNAYQLRVDHYASTTLDFSNQYTFLISKKSTSSTYNGGYAYAIGANSMAYGAYSRTFAEYALATYSATAFSRYALALGNYSIALGASSVAEGSPSLSIGQNSYAKGYNSVSIGAYSAALGYYSVTLGRRTIAKSDDQTIVGLYNADNSTALFVVGIGNSETNRKNGFVVDKSGNTIVGRNLYIKGSNNNGSGYISSSNNTELYFNVNNKIPLVLDGLNNTISSSSSIPRTISLGTSGVPWKEVYADKFIGVMESRDVILTDTTGSSGISNKIRFIRRPQTDDYLDYGIYGQNTKGLTFAKYNGNTNVWTDMSWIDLNGVYHGSVEIVGDLTQLNTSSKTNIVDAINEVNQKATNNQGGGVINDSTISPFYGFTSSDSITITNSSYTGNDGLPVYDSYKSRFIYRVDSTYYANWLTAYLYNDNYSSQSPTAKLGTIFSYANKHWIVVNGTLQDMSVLLSKDQTANATTKGVVLLSDATTGNDYNVDRGVAATPNAVANVATAARNYTNTTASQTLESANNYTDNQISAKIQLVTALPSNPISDVLYLIQET